MKIPTLATSRLELAYPLVHDNMNVDHYLKWFTNEEVVRFSEQRHFNHTASSQRSYISSFQRTGDYFWEIRRNSVPIGSITASLDKNNKTANIGIMMGATRMWGQGYGSEAWDAACSFLFSEGLRKLEAGCMASNYSMQKVLDKNGFRYEATLSGHFLLNGKPEDALYYGKTSKAKIIPIK